MGFRYWLRLAVGPTAIVGHRANDKRPAGYACHAKGLTLVQVWAEGAKSCRVLSRTRLKSESTCMVGAMWRHQRGQTSVAGDRHAANATAAEKLQNVANL